MDLPPLPPVAAGAGPGAALGRHPGATAVPTATPTAIRTRDAGTVDDPIRRTAHGHATGDLLADSSSTSGRTSPMPAGQRLETGVEPDRLVKTHCCFCGQQCGIQLKVKDNAGHRLRAVGGVPVQPGHALPQGRQALPAGRASRPAAARLSRATPPRRAASARCAYDEAIGRVAAEIRAHPVGARPRRLRRAQRREPDHREGVPDGQVRPRLPEDGEHRLQRPALHGQRRGRATRRPSASTARPTPGPTSPRPRSIWISGANIAECSPITTNYVWQARENGAKIIVVDPRITPIARTCDLFLPVKPGRDVALFNGILHLMIEHDWLDHDFIERAHRRLRAGGRARPASGRRGARRR